MSGFSKLLESAEAFAPESDLDSFRLWLLVSIAATAVLTSWRYFTRVQRDPAGMDALPGPWRSALPLIGNLLSLARPDFHRILLRWSDKYGGIYRMKLLWKEIVVVTDPQALSTILGRGVGALDKAADDYSSISYMCCPHGSPNLLTSPTDDTWKAVRKAVAISFSSANIKRKFPVVLSLTTQLIEWIYAQGPDVSVDIDQAALRVTLDVIGLVGFGHDFGSVKLQTVPKEHLLRVMPRCFTEVMMQIANPFRRIAMSGYKDAKGTQSHLAFQSAMRGLLKGMRERGCHDLQDTDLGTQLYRLLGSTPQLNEARILSEIGILFVGGFETTGHTISWTLMHIATTPGTQDQIKNELSEFGLLGGSRPIEFEDLGKLTFLTACMKEAMRILPVASIMGRSTGASTVKIGNVNVPPHTLVATPLFCIHNSHHNWEKPQEFRPERWQGVPHKLFVAGTNHQGKIALLKADQEESNFGWRLNSRPNMQEASRGMSYMPFSDGPRSCVGQALAKVEVMTVLAMILSHFTVQLADEMNGSWGVRKRESTHLTLQTRGTRGIQMHLIPHEPRRALSRSAACTTAHQVDVDVDTTA